MYTYNIHIIYTNIYTCTQNGFWRDWRHSTVQQPSDLFCKNIEQQATFFCNQCHSVDGGSWHHRAPEPGLRLKPRQMRTALLPEIKELRKYHSGRCFCSAIHASHWSVKGPTDLPSSRCMIASTWAMKLSSCNIWGVSKTSISKPVVPSFTWTARRLPSICTSRFVFNSGLFFVGYVVTSLGLPTRSCWLHQLCSLQGKTFLLT